jgi:hypothetical protein
MQGNIEDMNQGQLQSSIENSTEVIKAAESGSSEYSPSQVEQARQQRSQIASYLEQVGTERTQLKELDTSSLLELLAS